MRVFYRLLMGVFIGFGPATAAGAQSAVSGTITDAVTQEVLPGATVRVEGRPGGVLADRYGRFVLPAPVGDSLILVVRFIGYEPGRVPLGPRERSQVSVRLALASDSLGAVTVSASGGALVAGTTVLTAREVARIPALLGEADALRALQLLPGVVQGAEGSTGLHVRGGSPDQTLLLLDGATVYNAAHLFGAVSVFNPDALQSLRLVKSGLPAREGGRIGSVLDITMREGRRDRVGVRGAVGVLASRLTVEGPFAAGRGAFIISGRRTFADLLARPLLDQSEPGFSSSRGYAFADGSAKANVDIDSRTRLFVSGYAGRDWYTSDQFEAFDFDGNGTPNVTEQTGDGLMWQNVTGTLRGTRVVSSRLFLTGLVAYSQYGFAIDRSSSEVYDPALGRSDEAYSFEQASGLREWTGRLDADWTSGSGHTVQVGGAVGDRDFRPVRLARSVRDAADTLSVEVEAVVETHNGTAYVEDAVRLSDRVLAVAGVRVDAHRAEGQTWFGPQPRARVEVDAGRGWRATAAAERLWQPLHLLSNAGVGLPTDLWVPATPRVPPASGEQVSAGVARSWSGWEATADVYARRMRGLVEYRDAQGSLPSGARWEADVLQGRGTSAGAELLLRRSEGRTQGWIGYALSRATRQFPEIDGGRTFPYRYDRTHQLTVVASHQLTARRTVGLSAIAATGLAATMPIGTFGFAGQSIQYTSRNGGRFPAYLRIDLSYEVDYGRGALQVGVYNVANRLNPFTLSVERTYEPDAATGSGVERRELTALSLFPALPYVSYQFEF